MRAQTVRKGHSLGAPERETVSITKVSAPARRLPGSARNRFGGPTRRFRGEGCSTSLDGDWRGVALPQKSARRRSGKDLTLATSGRNTEEGLPRS
jgi:hypothetical protein